MVGEEAWRLIPPEEKFEIIAESHSLGVMWASVLILIGGTLAVAFQMPLIFWACLIASPIVFQFSASRKWRSLRPQILMSYLAARSVVRRYAYAVKSADLQIKLLFRGDLIHHLSGVTTMNSLNEEGVRYKVVPVWVALFPDAVIIVSEAKGGAKLEFGRLVNSRFSVENENEEEQEGYSQTPSITLKYDDRVYGNQQVKLESRHPAALTVFIAELDKILATPQAKRVDFVADDFNGEKRETGDALSQLIPE